MRLYEPVVEAARRTPHALAVDAPDGRLDYAALDALMRPLRRRAHRPGGTFR